MAFKFVAFATLLAYVSAGNIAAPLAYAAAPAYAKTIVSAAPAPLTYAAPIAKTVISAEEYDPNPQYSYGYDIHDELTGDSKSQSETRNGDVVQGSYSVVDPDGVKRTVEYTADPIHGFNAVVHREPLGAPIAKVAAAPLGYATAPIAKVAAPFAYSAPVTYTHQPAPYAYPAAPAIAYHH